MTTKTQFAFLLSLLTLGVICALFVIPLDKFQQFKRLYPKAERTNYKKNNRNKIVDEMRVLTEGFCPDTIFKVGLIEFEGEIYCLYVSVFQKSAEPQTKSIRDCGRPFLGFQFTTKAIDDILSNGLNEKYVNFIRDECLAMGWEPSSIPTGSRGIQIDHPIR